MNKQHYPSETLQQHSSHHQPPPTVEDSLIAQSPYEQLQLLITSTGTSIFLAILSAFCKAATSAAFLLL